MYKHLISTQRSEIFAYKQCGKSVDYIAQATGVHKSTICLVEYTNKLIRQYIPKGSDFDEFNAARIMEIQKKLNSRPRKKLDYSTPKREFFRHFN